VISNVMRFLIEFTRYHEQALPFGLPLSITQWIALGLAAGGAWLLWAPHSRTSKVIPSPAH